MNEQTTKARADEAPPNRFTNRQLANLADVLALWAAHDMKPLHPDHALGDDPEAAAYSLIEMLADAGFLLTATK